MLGMVQHLNNSTFANNAPLPDRELRANGKVRQCRLGYKELNAKLLGLVWRKTIFKRNKKTNGEIFGADTKNSSIFALGNCPRPSSCFGRKKRDFNNDFRRDWCTHCECLTCSLRGWPKAGEARFWTVPLEAFVRRRWLQTFLQRRRERTQGRTANHQNGPADDQIPSLPTRPKRQSQPRQ